MPNPNHSALLIASGHRIVVGIDFGTLSCAFVGKISKLGYFNDFTSGPISSRYTALKDAFNDDAAGTGKMLLTKIKFLVEPSTNHNADANLPNTIDALELVAEYLHQLFEYLMERLRNTFGTTLQPEDLQYCLTVPAIWSEHAKHTMRRAAARAGLISPGEVNMPRLSVVLEPEAAAIYCFKKVKEAPMRPGETAIVVDAGGGTVDIVAYRFQSGIDASQKMVEVAPGTGGLCGSTFIDEVFLDWLGSKVGKMALADLKREKGVDYLQDGVSDNVYITLADMQSFFDPIVEQVLQLIEKQLDKCPNKRSDKLFGVGGFMASPYLQKKIKERISDKCGIIIFPRDPGAAVVQGAALHGLNPHAIQARFSRFTYAFKHNLEKHQFLTKYPRGPEPTSADVFLHEEKGVPYLHVYHPKMTANQLVEVQDFYSTKVYPLYSWQTSLTLQLVATAEEYKQEMPVSCVNGHFDVGSLIVDGIPLSGPDRSVKLTFYFGLTELTAIARVNATNDEKRISVNFSTR
ncbi:uncharacterized protein EV422DRAFT_509232 [Fimicolochytrium jonesii]|uniref:uncharacterized protein n=1 Tax=Fimicolochytrium jonesii TaxID=1396493 RepID=UPI0022FE1A06|nr:uncharacterized protein EV422DRAFT_509232 [Fimicolochytrium jonesii]KAI8817205.1 hypothetical protein EV422DRAFT_509232 [Fimicolochytrium jonesii]